MKRLNSKQRKIRFIISPKCFYMSFHGYYNGTTGAHDDVWRESYIKKKLVNKIKKVLIPLL